jgi:hypothetical protein
MMVPIVQVAVLVVLTHTFRGLVSLAGPRRSGLLMGLPSTTAVVLVCSGLERGLVEATGAAEACLVGLVAAASVPLVYARAVGARWPLPWAPIVAVAGYLALASSLRSLPAVGPWGCVGVSTLGILAACSLARRVRPSTSDGSPGVKKGVVPRESTWTWLRRSAVPAAYFGAVRGLRALAGTDFAGLFIPFPGTSLVVLVTTHLEAGPAAACRMAAAMPVGGLSMLAFLTAFRFGCPRLGLGWGAGLAYLAAVATMLAVERFATSRDRSEGRTNRGSIDGSWRTLARRVDPGSRLLLRRPRRRRPSARFSPILERLTG